MTPIENIEVNKVDIEANLNGKSFPCTICDNVFVHKTELNKHLKLVHKESKTKGEKPFKCTVCKKTFAMKISLRKHIMSIHEEKSEPESTTNRNYSIVKGWTGNSNCYLSDGFSYVKNSMSSKTIYLNCNERNNKDNNCQGYANINRLTDHMFMKKPHNHEPRQEKIKVNKIRHSIFDAAGNMSGKSLIQTFAVETEKEGLGHKVFYANLESSMRRKRGENYPRIPKPFGEVPDLMQNTSEEFNRNYHGLLQDKTEPKSDIRNNMTYSEDPCTSTNNPWLVDSIQSFSFLNCPECNFKVKEEDNFHKHAVENHPLSFVLFDQSMKKELPDFESIEQNSFPKELTYLASENIKTEFVGIKSEHAVETANVIEKLESPSELYQTKTKETKDKKMFSDHKYLENSDYDIFINDDNNQKTTLLKSSFSKKINEKVMKNPFECDTMTQKQTPKLKCESKSSLISKTKEKLVKGPIDCDYCGESFTGPKKKRNFDRHIKRHMKCMNPPEFKCDFCNRTYQSKWSLQVHNKNYCRENEILSDPKDPLFVMQNAERKSD